MHIVLFSLKMSQPSSGPKKTYKSGTVKERRNVKDFKRAGSDRKQMKLFEARTTATEAAGVSSLSTQSRDSD